MMSGLPYPNDNLTWAIHTNRTHHDPSMDVATLLAKMPQRVNDEGFYIPSPPFYQTQQQVFRFPDSQTQLNPTASWHTPAFYPGPVQQYYNHSCYYNTPQNNQVQFAYPPQPAATEYTRWMPMPAGCTTGSSPTASHSTIPVRSPPSTSFPCSPEATSLSKENLSFTEAADALDSILGDDSGFYTSDSSYEDCYLDITCLSPMTITLPDSPNSLNELATLIQVAGKAPEKPKPTKSSRIKISKLKKGLSCGICLKRFQTREEYSTHVITHKVKRSYPCDLCGATFRQMSTMRTHRRIHTGEMPYSCMVCHRRFADHSALHKHKLVHTGERPYKCTVSGCTASFTQSGNLKRHIKNIHKL